MNVLYWDIETSPHLAYVWGLHDQNISLAQLKEPGGVIAVGTMAEDEKRARVKSVHNVGYDDMLGDTRDRLDWADVLVSWNGRGFDTRMLNNEIVKAGFTPPSPAKEVDLCLAARKRFRMPSNKLQYVSTFLGLPGKVQHTGFQLWVDCIAGDDKAWRLMHKYCKQDVELLRPLHKQLLPWITGYPNRALYADSDVPACTRCGSHDLQRRGVATTAAGRFQRFQCMECGGWMRSAKREFTVEMREVA